MAAEWGHILEPVIRGYYAARHGYDQPDLSIDVPTESLYHRELTWLRATPDGIVRSLTPDGEWISMRRVQVKNVGPRTSLHWGLDSRARSVPPHYRIQDVVEAAVTGIGSCDFAVLFGGNDYAEFPIERDRDLEESVLEQLAAFWRLVETDTPPEVDHAEEWRAYFADRLPTERVVTSADENLEAWIDRWKSARDVRVNADRDESCAKNNVLEAAATAAANRIKSRHGEIAVIQPKGRAPYVKAPASWGVE